jgi:serine/threonine-protein kinase
VPILTPEERVGTTVDKYRLDRIVATGGMATVYAGVHAWTERAVAVKILNYEHARDPEVVRRFLQEARAAAQLKHPNVVDVLDMGQAPDGTVYLVLELLMGETLKSRLRRGPLEPSEVRALILPVMRAVASAHDKSVVHRDLKPDNVFLADEGGTVVPKLLDFGIAKITGDSSSTRTGLMVGTPQYMAPEQVRGERDVGPPADVYSMGVVLHLCLTGRLPFEGESAAAILARVLTERAKPIQTIAPHVPSGIAKVVDRALQHEVHARFRDMAEMTEALEGGLDGTQLEVPPLEATEVPTRIAVPSALDAASSALGAGNDTIATPTPAPAFAPSTTVGLAASPTPTPSAAPSVAPPGETPSTTPFAWASAPSEPPKSTSPARAIAIGAALGLVALLALSGLAMSATPGEVVATPVAPSAAVSSPAAPPATTAPVVAEVPREIAPADVDVPSEAVAVEPEVEPAAVQPDVIAPDEIEPVVVAPPTTEPTVSPTRVVVGAGRGRGRRAGRSPGA